MRVKIVTIAVTNESCFGFDLSKTNSQTVASTGSTFNVADASGFVQGNGLYYYGSGTDIKVARCTRSGNSITIAEDLDIRFPIGTHCTSHRRLPNHIR